jgi:hypothetical protein
MDAIGETCLHCEKPITKPTRGDPQRFCCDAHRKAYADWKKRPQEASSEAVQESECG